MKRLSFLAAGLLLAGLATGCCHCDDYCDYSYPTYDAYGNLVQGGCCDDGADWGLSRKDRRRLRRHGDDYPLPQYPLPTYGMGMSTGCDCGMEMAPMSAMAPMGTMPMSTGGCASCGQGMDGSYQMAPLTVPMAPQSYVPNEPIPAPSAEVTYGGPVFVPNSVQTVNYQQTVSPSLPAPTTTGAPPAATSQPLRWVPSGL